MQFGMQLVTTWHNHKSIFIASTMLLYHGGFDAAIAMLELQRIQFAGWALTEGQHRPKAGKKKKTREAGLFFWLPVVIFPLYLRQITTVLYHI